ncbi:MAG: type II secretion system protein GspE, partial [Desulfobacteraceae bacterium]
MNFKTMDLSHILKHRFDISDEALSDARLIQEEKGGRLGEILVTRKVITETQMLEALGMQYELPFWPELPMENIGTDFAKSISIQFLKRHFIIPMSVPSPTGQTVSDAKGNGESTDAVSIIAVYDPSDFNAVDDLSDILDLKDYKLVLSTKQAILSAINLSFEIGQDNAQQLVDDMEDDSAIISEIENTADLLEDTSDAPIIKLVNHILSQSIKARASDIHIEPYQ